jgi:DHA1 family inner membrane transport protein
MPVALLTLTLAAFAICTAEWGIAGLLPLLSNDLAVSIPTAGLLVTGYALGVAIGGPVLAMLTTGFQRKGIMIAVMGVFVVGQALCALAPSYGTLLAARLLVACGHGLFFGIAAVVAAATMPSRPGFAVSMLYAGASIANVFGIPAGAAIGNALGWRATFWTIGVVALAATAAMALLIPSTRTEDGVKTPLRDEVRALNHQQVYLTYLVIFLQLTGYVALQTYFVPLLTDVTGVPLGETPLFLLLLGVGSVIGGLAGGKLADWKLMPTLVAIFFVQMVLVITLTFTAHHAALFGINLFLLGAVVYAFVPPVMNRILTGAKAAPNLASTVSNTAFNIGIAAGAWLGGAAITAGLRYDQLPYVTLAFVFAAGCVAIVSMRLDKAAQPAVVAA